MRITNVDLYSNGVKTVAFALRREDASSRYMVRQIAGMDADELTPKFYGFGENSGSKFYDFGMKPRELVIRTILNPTFELNEEHSQIRDELYKAISSTRTGLVELRFYSGAAAVARLFGFIIKLEAGYFNKVPEAQLTLRCDDPLFRGIAPTRLDGSIIPDRNPLTLADSMSTAPHGFTAELTIDNPIAELTIQEQEVDPDWHFTVVPDGGFLAGDQLYFSSDYAKKHLWMDRGGVITHLIDRIEPGSVWPIIFPGGNTVYFPEWADFTIDLLEYYPAYWGV